MRVTLTELATYRVSTKFRTGDAVSIVVYDITNASTPVLTSAACTEIGATGVFYWSFANLDAQPAGATEYLWTMTSNNSGDYTGEALYAGDYPDDVLDAIDAVSKKIGTPVALDGAAASIAGMLTKMADDNGGADFDATRDSQNKIAVALQTVDANVDDVLEDTGTTLPGTLTTIEGKIDTVDDVADAVKLKTDGLNFTGTDVKATLDGETVDVGAISGDATAADNLELQFDGTGLTGDTYPARQDQIAKLSIGSAAISTVAGSFTLATGSEVGGTTYANTFNKNATYHQLADTAGTLDGYYEFNIGADGVPVEVVFWGRMMGPGDNVGIYGYDWVAPGWQQLETWAGQGTTTDGEKIGKLRTTMVGTGADVGKVRVRIYGTGLTSSNFYNDFMYLSFSVVNRSVGYSDGAVWVDEGGNSGTTPYINGTADNPCPWTDALVIAAALGIYRFRAVSGTTIAPLASVEEYVIVGQNWDLELNGQDVTTAYFDGPRVSGIASSTGGITVFKSCGIGDATIPPARFVECGFGRLGGTFVAASAGQYLFMDCVSMVPGAGTPVFRFDGLGNTTGINFRRWSGGSNIVIDADCTISMEVVTGGGQTIDVGGGAAEIRGICRALTLTMEAGGVAQFAGITGPVTINGTGGTVRLYGVIGEITDNSGGAVTIDAAAVSLDNINAEALIARFQKAPVG